MQGCEAMRKRGETVTMTKKTLSLLVDNTPGLLSRVAGLFTRRAFNIESITAGTTDDEKLTRMTIVAQAESEAEMQQVVKQLAKLENVIQIRELTPETSVIRELVLVRAKASEEERAGVISMADVFRAKVVDISGDDITFELTGHTSKIEAFMKLLGKERIRKVARTGAIGLNRGMLEENAAELYNR